MYCVQYILFHFSICKNPSLSSPRDKRKIYKNLVFILKFTILTLFFPPQMQGIIWENLQRKRTKIISWFAIIFTINMIIPKFWIILCSDRCRRRAWRGIERTDRLQYRVGKDPAFSIDRKIVDWVILALLKEVKLKDIMECYCSHNSVIEEWGVNAVHLMKVYSFADGFHVNIYITLKGKILFKGHK